MSGLFKTTIKTKSAGRRILTSHCHVFALFDNRAFLEFVTLTCFANSAVFSALRSRSFMINAGSIDCGALYWKLWREFGILIFPLKCLQPKHRVISLIEQIFLTSRTRSSRFATSRLSR